MRVAARAKAQPALPLEYNLLLTATLCLLAFGALLAFAFVCLLAVKVPGLGVSVNGARRWLGAGPVQFQPSEVAKLALVLYGAKLLAQRPGRIHAPADVS